jgi:hypothetical protein
VAWQGNGMASVNQMGKTQSKPLAERHGKGKAGQGKGMVCVNPAVEILGAGIN